MDGQKILSVVVDRHNISYIKFIFEGYDGMAVVTTINRYKAVVNIVFLLYWQKSVLDIVEALRHEGVIKEVIDHE